MTAPERQEPTMWISTRQRLRKGDAGWDDFTDYDLSDWTWTSSFLNCGRWQGQLAALAAGSRSNELLDLAAAKRAQDILPAEWNDDPHSDVTIWAL